MLGCDITSHLYGIGKGRAVQLLLTNNSLRESTAIFGDKLESLDDIVAAREWVLLVLHGCLDISDLDTARNQVFHRKVITATTFVHPRELPPTQATAKSRSLRVYCQVLVEFCQVLARESSRPLNLGMETAGYRSFCANKTDLSATLSQLMKIIKRSCRIDGCDSKNCTCKKNGFECTVACRTCKGSPYNNSKFQEELNEEE